jgi:hypothetical protein
MDHVQFKRVNYKLKVNSTCNVENPVPEASSLIDVSLERTCRRRSRHLQGRVQTAWYAEFSSLQTGGETQPFGSYGYCKVLFTLHVTNHEHAEWLHNQHKVCDRAYSRYSTYRSVTLHSATVSYRNAVTFPTASHKWITKFPELTRHTHIRSWQLVE